MMACKALGAHTLALRNKEKWQSVGWKKSVSKTSSILGEHTGKMKAMPRLGGKNLTVSPSQQPTVLHSVLFYHSIWGMGCSGGRGEETNEQGKHNS